jgi:hypothetical protein
MNKNIKEHPTGFMKWRQKLGNTICIKDMLKFTFHHLKENKLKIFRWKLLHMKVYEFLFLVFLVIFLHHSKRSRGFCKK